jgi:ribosomal protein L24
MFFIFLISLENIDRDIKKFESKHENEMKVISHKFNIEYENLEKLKLELFKSDEKNVSLEKRISKLEKEILQLKSGDNSKFY